jgi:hypothetical protein
MMVRSLDEIKANVLSVQRKLEEAALSCGRNPADIRMMAVTKRNDADRVNAAIEAGALLLGENRAQELLEKYDHYHKENCEIHFIGHLQTNKVRQIIDKVDLIQSLDRIDLAREIDRCAQNAGKIMPVLIEVNIGREETKSGVLPEKLEDFVDEAAAFKHLTIKGLMAIPPHEADPMKNEGYFEQMHRHFIDIGSKKTDNIDMHILSMGMTDDYPLAIRHGSTMIRVGRAIFGERM